LSDYGCEKVETGIPIERVRFPFRFLSAFFLSFLPPIFLFLTYMGKNNLSVAAEKIFVLDTSVILYDHDAFQNFQEHDVVIPIQVLEELDNLKSGNDTRNYEARSFIRLMDDISRNSLVSEWIPLNGKGRGRFKVVMDDIPARVNAELIFGEGKFDHRILNAALSLQEQYPSKRVTLVSKDICLRLKAKALDLYSEDYETGKVKNVEELYTGNTTINSLPVKMMNELISRKVLPIEQTGISINHDNHFFILNSKNKTAAAFYNPKKFELEHIPHRSVYNIEPRNPEQAFAIHALMNPAIKLVTIQGNAGTGKTLLALASALEQRKNYRQIFVTRPLIPLSNKDIGFLPGDVKSKVDPYMAPIWDNLKFIKDQLGDDHKAQAKIDELVITEKISVAPLAFIRGRTLTKIFFIVDEADTT
jgi:PhoH-like ATPase